MNAYRKMVKAERLIHTRFCIEQMQRGCVSMTGDEFIRLVLASGVMLYVHPDGHEFAEQLSADKVKKVADAIPVELLAEDVELAISMDDIPAILGWQLPDGMTLARKPVTSPTTSVKQATAAGTPVTAANNREHISDGLAYLKQAAERFWTQASRTDATTHPKNATVAAWLTDKGLSPSLAKAGASIIRPKWAHKGRMPEE